MNKNLELFFEEAKKNEELRSRLTPFFENEAATDEIVKIAKEYGFTLTTDDLNSSNKELSPDELENVVGGGRGTSMYICPYCGARMSQNTFLDRWRIMTHNMSHFHEADSSF